MLFGFTTLFVALALSTVAAYYSILGLTAIFSAAAIPVIIMGVALELGKINATVWLHKNWRRSPFLYKTYLIPAVAFLMLLTSMGIFGFLSKAHSDQSLVSGNSTAQLAIIDEKIKIQRENIDTARRALAQLDAQVNERLSRGNTEQGVERAATLRRQQTAERNRLLKDVNDAQNSIQRLNEERAPIAAEFRKVEAEVGPIKYIAALLYDDNVDQTILEKAVRWVIILIVVVFDPLALVLILAGTRHLEWSQEERKLRKLEQAALAAVPPEEPKEETKPEEPKEEIKPEEPKEEIKPTATVEEPKEETKPEEPKEEPFDISKHPYLFNVPKSRTPPGIDPVGPIVARPEDFVPPPIETTYTAPELTAGSETKIEPALGLPETNSPTKIKLDVPPEALTPPQKSRVEVVEAVDLKQKENTKLIADNDGSEPTEVKAHFGIAFPVEPEKGEMYLRVDFLPSRLFKFNGNKWIEIEKEVTDTYLYNEEYIQYLVTEISAGRYDPDNLTERERQQVTDFLNNEQGNNTSRSS